MGSIVPQIKGHLIYDTSCREVESKGAWMPMQAQILKCIYLCFFIRGYPFALFQLARLVPKLDNKPRA